MSPFLLSVNMEYILCGYGMELEYLEGVIVSSRLNKHNLNRGAILFDTWTQRSRMTSRLGHRSRTLIKNQISSISRQIVSLVSCGYNRGMSTLKLVHETREYLFHEVVDRCICLTHIEQSQRREMFNSLYWPVYSYILEQRKNAVTTAGVGDRKPFLIGISAPQGCGKTTLTTVLEEMFAFTGSPAASMSLDDFYLRGEEQDRLAAKHSSNALLRYRGNGTLLRYS